jgi:glycosyltransferase involved in cell wall biosynthesis
VVHSGIDLRRFEAATGGEEFRRELGLEPVDFLVGCVGALAAQKGHLLLLEAVAALAPSIPQLHVALVGQGDLQARILDEARGLGIGDRIHLAGFRDDVPQVTSAFNLAVLPSVAGEGSPATVKEAMAAGVPVIATDIGGVREILQDGVQGLLITAGSANALQAALRRLIEDAALRDAMGRAGRERAREFSMERMIERTEDVYASLCDPGYRR